MSPTTRYARSGAVNIAYQVVGEPDPDRPDLVLAYGYGSNVDVQWEHPRFAAFLDQLAELGRLVLFDKRDTGLSDHTGRTPTLEERVDDMEAVMDAAEAPRAVVLGFTGGATVAALLAATHPDRVESLVLYGARAHPPLSTGFEVVTDEVEGPSDEYLEAVRRTWGTGITAHLYARSMLHEPGFVEWCAHYERSMASPGNAGAMVWMSFQWDLRPVLPTINVPTLVLWRQGDRTDFATPEDYRYVADQIPGARGVELPGNDHWPWIDDPDAVLDAIREFLANRTTEARARVHLAAVLFTDIVGSTVAAAERGGQRWSAVLGRHDAIARTQVERFGGRLVKQTGDGILAVFDGPGRSVQCALALTDALHDIGITIRSGVHVGEVDIRGTDVAGLTVHIASRVCTVAADGEVLITRTVKDLMIGSRVSLAERGTHELKGVPDSWSLFAASRP